MGDRATSDGSRRGNGDQNRLDGQVVIVADADTSRGGAAARALVDSGVAVVLVGRDGAALGALARDLLASGARVAVMQTDVDDARSRTALAEMVRELFEGRPA